MTEEELRSLTERIDASRLHHVQLVDIDACASLVTEVQRLRRLIGSMREALEWIVFDSDCQRDGEYAYVFSVKTMQAIESLIKESTL